jgi:hypothetical protein
VTRKVESAIGVAAGISVYPGLAILGGDGVGPFFSEPARAVLVALSAAALFTDASLSRASGRIAATVEYAFGALAAAPGHKVQPPGSKTGLRKTDLLTSDVPQCGCCGRGLIPTPSESDIAIHCSHTPNSAWLCEGARSVVRPTADRRFREACGPPGGQLRGSSACRRPIA